MSWVYSSASTVPGSGIPRAGEPGFFILRGYAVLAVRPWASPTIQRTTTVVRSVVLITPRLRFTGRRAAVRVGIAYAVCSAGGER